MLQFQKRQGDFRNFAYAQKGGDGTSGTWEPGQTLVESGTCPHDLWENESLTPRAPLEAMLEAAKAHKLDAKVFDIGVDDMKRVLSARCPVQISMSTGEAFADLGRDGVFDASEKPSGDHGYHAMLCVGYIGNYFIVKNSWGTDWGDNGYCYIPKKVLMQSEPEPVAIMLRAPAGTPEPVQGTKRFCTECGTQLKPDAHFCQDCGTKVG